jgi:hypothetical protein
LRWRRLLDRNTVIGHRGGSQLVELSSSPRKAKAGVAGFTLRFSSGRGAGIRYMADSDALMLLHAAVALPPVQAQVQRIKSRPRPRTAATRSPTPGDVSGGQPE